MQNYKRVELGKYIVADQGICHGQPTFKGTRKMAHLLLLCFLEHGKTIEDVARSAEMPVEAVEEAIRLSATAVHDYLSLPDPYPETAIDDWVSDGAKLCTGEVK